MSINGISNSGMEVNPYAYTDRSRKTAETGNFAEEVQKAEESQSTLNIIPLGSHQFPA